MTEPDDVRFFATVTELRAWLPEAPELDAAWLGFHRARTGRDGVTFAVAAEELATIGWVEGERTLVDGSSYAVRFAPGRVPRRPAPPTEWRPEGRWEMPELAPAYEDLLRSDPAAWEFFSAQPPGYRRTAIWWVMSGKREATRDRRLAALVEASAAGERLPQLLRIR